MSYNTAARVNNENYASTSARKFQERVAISRNSLRITTTPGVERIFASIDRNRMKYIAEGIFDKYAKKVVEFVERNKLTDSERKERLEAWKLLRNYIEPHINGGFLALGGSTLSNFATKKADLDLCFAIRCTAGAYEEDSVSTHVLERIKFALKLTGKPLVDSVRFISARVPILKISLRHPFDSINIDINCNCVAGIYNSHLLYYYSRMDERLVQMNMVLKEWAKNNFVIDPRFGKLNSYTISLMVIHFLQCGVSPPILPNFYALFPQYFNGTGDVEGLQYDLSLDFPPMQKNDRSIGELIYGFFDYYARFDYDNWWISIREGRVFHRSRLPESDKQYLFFLEEAYDGMTVPKNLTKRYKLMEIIREFKEGREQILADIYKGYELPLIDTSGDYFCEVEAAAEG